MFNLHADHGGSHLVWIQSDLVRERKIRPDVCYPVSNQQRIDKVLKTLSFARDIWGGGGGEGGAGQRHTFIEAVKKKAMVEGGHWVWQADKPARAPTRQRAQHQHGTFLGNQPGQGQFPRPTAPPIKQQQSIPNQVQGQTSQGLNSQKGQ
jgi:hypothetical protein